MLQFPLLFFFSNVLTVLVFFSLCFQSFLVSRTGVIGGWGGVKSPESVQLPGHSTALDRGKLGFLPNQLLSFGGPFPTGMFT